MDATDRSFSPWVIFWAAVGALGAYFYKFHSLTLSDSHDRWGQFGDYLGGTLNPLVAFGALLWLMRSVKLQKQELADTRRALEESQRAQQQQADTSLLAAQIQSLNIQLATITNALGHYRSRQMQYIEHQNRPDHPRSYLNEYGDSTPLDVLRAEVISTIVVLEREESELLESIKGVSKKFKGDVHASYAN